MPSSMPAFLLWKGCSELGPLRDKKRGFLCTLQRALVSAAGHDRDLPSESVLGEQKKALASELAIYISSSETPQLHY